MEDKMNKKLNFVVLGLALIMISMFVENIGAITGRICDTITCGGDGISDCSLNNSDCTEEYCLGSVQVYYLAMESMRACVVTGMWTDMCDGPMFYCKKVRNCWLNMADREKCEEGDCKMGAVDDYCFYCSNADANWIYFPYSRCD